MPKVSETHLTERRDQILDAAADCFAANGFHSTSMADIIRACGMSAGSVYRYYKSKDDLIAAIIDRYLQMLVFAVVERNKDSSEPMDLVASALEIMEQKSQIGPPPVFLKLMPQFWAEAMRNEMIREKAIQFYSLMEHQLSEVVKRAQDQGLIPSAIPPRGIAQIVISLIQGYLLQKMMLGIHTDPQSYLTAIGQFLHPQSPQSQSLQLSQTQSQLSQPPQSINITAPNAPSTATSLEELEKPE
jgi:AcrR family transcriptional regulator